jgi:micrococcal nuclease
MIKNLFNDKSSIKRLLKYGAVGTALLFTIGWSLPSPASTDNKTSVQSTRAVSKAPEIETQPEKPKAGVELYRVVKVIDGDTIDLDINGQTERIRLIGMDTPETVDPRKTVECFGKEASNKAKEMLTAKSVKIAADPTQDNRDKYKRLLRYVYLEDGTNFNKLMISEGYAHEYTYYVPYQLQVEFKAAQKDAEENERGLWSPSSCGGDTSTSSLPVQSSSTSAARGAASPSVSSNSNCNPNYTPCIPNASYDLDCGDLSVSVHVVGTDVYRLDRDGDGYGCETN